jgi:hypothetical protein
VPAVTPVPDKGMDRVELDAFEVRVTAPLALAADWGANVTVKLALWPAVSVTGATIPLKPNPVPLIAICGIVTLAAPVFVIVSDRA